MRSPVRSYFSRAASFVALILAAALCLPGGIVSAADLPPIPAALRGRLVAASKNGDVTGVPEATAAAGAKKYYALYFSAGWCPPCHLFTPKLVGFYNEMHPQHPEFEVVFISSDHSEADMVKYIKEFNMPWPALPFWALKTTPKITGYGGMGIPRLVLVDAAGNVLSDSFKGELYLGPEHVLVDLQARLVSGGGQAAAR